MSLEKYKELLASKKLQSQLAGFEPPSDLGSGLFPHQRAGVEFALRLGRAAIFYDTGLGKTACALEWGRHVARHANVKVLMLCPLAVAQQHAKEAERVGVSARVIRGNPASWEQDVYICNYDRLDKLDLSAYGAVILDESSILKAFSGKTKTALIDAFKRTPYRLACTATPAPNDHMELGNHAEFLSVMDSREMLSRFFVNDTSTASQQWRLKGHARESFWDWVASWARMAGRPSDLGFSDDGFLLPALDIHRHVLAADIETDTEGYLFRMPMMSATGLHKEKKLTLPMRADKIAEIVSAEPDETWVIWCDTNYEADALKDRLPDAIEVRGSMTIDRKESILNAFARGEVRQLITKCDIAGFGSNWQHCARMAFVGLNYSYERFYQGVRRCWRFGQKRDVHVHTAVADTELEIIKRLTRKQTDHETSKQEMAAAMARACLHAETKTEYRPRVAVQLPEWVR